LDSSLVVLITVGFTLFALALVLALMLVPIGIMVGLPFRYRKRWASWTEDGDTLLAYDHVASGSTTGALQIFPASYLYEHSIHLDAPVDRAVGAIHDFYDGQPLSTMLLRDAHGFAVDLRIPSGLGPGWIGVFKVEPEGEGSVVHVRMRSTTCLVFPVFTFFLALPHHLHLERMVTGALKSASPLVDPPIEGS